MTRSRTFLLWTLSAFCLLGAALSTDLVQRQVQAAQQSQQSIQLQRMRFLNLLLQQRQTEQQEQVQRQQERLLQQQRAESEAKNPAVDELKESFLPPDNGTYDVADVGVALLTNGKSVKSKKQWLAIPRSEYFQAVAERDTTSSSSLKKMSSSYSGWGPYSCCRRATGIQIKERKRSGYVEFVSRYCSRNYCKKCQNDMSSCPALKRIGCNENSRFYSFMSAHCPETCGWCAPQPPAATQRPTPPPTTRRPTTTRPRPTTAAPTKAASDENLVRVRVFYREQSGPHQYMFTLSSRTPPYPWKSVSRSSNRGEVESFYMYSKPTGFYFQQVTFCKARVGNAYKWMITKGRCGRGWQQDFRLYASSRPVPSSSFIVVNNRGQAPWTSRVTDSAPCCGYTKGPFTLFVPKTPTTETQTTRKPVTTRRPTPTPWRPRPRPTTTRYVPRPKPTAPGSQPMSPFDKDCLDYHNFFRSAHNVPPLQWDPELVTTSQRWATYLSRVAPSHPFQLEPGIQRTPGWPHSVRGTMYRKRGVGENIAWDFSRDGSPAKESVLRWYAEIFYYDRRNPTHSHAGKPVGHLTQMLWRETTHLGCAVAKKTVRRGSYDYLSTYTVSHYAPGGNIVYNNPRDTLANYNENVPEAKAETCRSDRNCADDGGCMGFSRGISCSCARDDTGGYRGRPRCIGSGGGCIASCDKPRQPITGYYEWIGECQGQRSCECVYNVVNYKAGAICS